ncbi:hypothetical protein D917_05410 [Trichinella nativa]|uniref:Uncharacterized protein n=1 Tax=Trichinella nativa TaxID=6335 RepID=A0A1Y3E4D8_9BILA|nr:hypothetical protein D917_05410 [Trichinella nativa]
MVAFQREEKPKTTSCLVMMLIVGCNGRDEEKSGGSNRPIGLRVGESPGAPCRAPLWLCVQWFGWEICSPVQGQCSTNPLDTSRLCLLSEFGKKSDSCPLLSTACAGRVRGAEPAPLFLSVGQHTPAISHSGSS